MAGSMLEFSRSEEHTSELQSRFDLVCRLLLEKKKAQFIKYENNRTWIKSDGPAAMGSQFCSPNKHLPSIYVNFFFFFNNTATTEIYTLSLHDALPISLEFS